MGGASIISCFHEIPSFCCCFWGSWIKYHYNIFEESEVQALELSFLIVCWGKALSWSSTTTASDAASALFPRNCMRFKLYHILWTFQIAGFALAGKSCKTRSSKLTILYRHLGLWVGLRLGTSWCGTLSWSNSSFQWDHVQHWNLECDLVCCWMGFVT